MTSTWLRFTTRSTSETRTGPYNGKSRDVL